MGKSTFSLKLSEEVAGVYFNLDEWMANLFSPDRPSENFIPWYNERKQRCIQQIWNTAQHILYTRVSVVLELGLIQQALRNEFFDCVERGGYSLKIFALEAAREVRKQRVLQRNQDKDITFSVHVSEQVFDLADALWEPIDAAECRDFTLEVVTTDS